MSIWCDLALTVHCVCAFRYGRLRPGLPETRRLPERRLFPDDRRDDAESERLDRAAAGRARHQRADYRLQGLLQLGCVTCRKMTSEFFSCAKGKSLLMCWWFSVQGETLLGTNVSVSV